MDECAIISWPAVHRLRRRQNMRRTHRWSLLLKRAIQLFVVDRERLDLRPRNDDSHVLDNYQRDNLIVGVAYESENIAREWVGCIYLYTAAMRIRSTKDFPLNRATLFRIKIRTRALSQTAAAIPKKMALITGCLIPTVARSASADRRLRGVQYGINVAATSREQIGRTNIREHVARSDRLADIPPRTFDSRTGV